MITGANDAIMVDSLEKTFHDGTGTVHALGPVSIQVPEGNFTCILGPTGCGKTTLLRIIAGLETPDAGHVTLSSSGTGGRPVVGYVFQQGALFPWMTVRANIEFPLKASGMDRERRREKTRRALEMVELEAFASSFPHQLSGGMQQRTALARSLVREPDILLLDEPFSSLDTRTSQLLQGSLRELWKEARTTVLFVTHNIEEAVYLAGEVLVLGHRPGTITRRQAIELSDPRDRLSDDFTGYLVSLRRTFEELVEEIPSP